MVNLINTVTLKHYLQMCFTFEDMLQMSLVENNLLVISLLFPYESANQHPTSGVLALWTLTTFLNSFIQFIFHLSLPLRYVDCTFEMVMFKIKT